MRAHVVDQHDQNDQDQHDRRGFLILKCPIAGVHQIADAAGADQTEHRGSANVGLEAIEGERNQIRQDLWQDRKGKDLRVAGAGGANRLDDSFIDIFNRL